MNQATSIMARLRDPKEKTALIWLAIASVPVWILIVSWIAMSRGSVLIFIGLGWLTMRIGEHFAAAYIKTNGVRLSESQLPEVYQIVKDSCDRLGIKPPDVYVMQQSLWNAFASKLAGRRLVVLFSGAVDSILARGDLRQLSWLIGHELGHHAGGHLDFGVKCAQLGGWLPWLILWHCRRCEFTCDRVGLYCAGDLHSAMSALVNSTVGAQLADRVNVAAAITQWEVHKKEFFVGYRTMYSTHPMQLCRMAELRNAAAALGLPETAPPPA